MNNKNIKILVALSGGVDSSVAAALLKKQGYQVIGAFCKFWSPVVANKKSACDENACCNYESLQSARQVCQKLDIPLKVFEVKNEFKKEVVDYFIAEYESGRTPNPCVVCNKKIKFGWLLDKAKKLGCDYLATGHYARLCREFSNFNLKFLNKFKIRNLTKSEILQKDVRFLHGALVRQLGRQASGKRLRPTFYNISNLEHQTYLITAKDEKKDQSYFLWQLDQKQLSKIIFPIGDLTKPEVRQLAKKYDLPTYNKPESQDICFVNKGINNFLAKYASKLNTPGDIADCNGNKVGRHQGLIYYTIGQRENLPEINYKNLSIKFDKHRIPPLYVIKLDVKNNRLIIGSKEDLYQKVLIADKLNFIIPITDKSNLFAKIRYNGKAEPCQIMFDNSKNKAKVIFKHNQLSITPGQSIVFYEKNRLIGGGIIKQL